MGVTWAGPGSTPAWRARWLTDLYLDAAETQRCTPRRFVQGGLPRWAGRAPLRSERELLVELVGREHRGEVLRMVNDRGQAYWARTALRLPLGGGDDDRAR